MNYTIVAHLLGWLFAILGAFLLIPGGVALAFGESVFPWLGSAVFWAATGGVLAWFTRTKKTRIRPRDSFVAVAGAWLAVSLVGALPYVLVGDFSIADAIFESASGFTTTGSTIMSDIEGQTKGLLFWRAFTQWLGGMGIIVFTIAILPLLGIGGMQLFKAEVPGPTADKVSPRVATTARALWVVYVGFTVAEIVALLLAGMTFYDAVCHSLTTLSTGGFSTKNASIAAFNSPLIEWIIIFFMFCGGINFVLHFKAFSSRSLRPFKDMEFYYYLATVVVGAALIAGGLVFTGTLTEGAIRTALFQSISLITTTGYATADFELWPNATLIVVMLMLVLGGMAGSTAGGVKGLRVLLSFRSLQSTLWRLIHPHAVRPVKYGRKVVSDNVLSGVWAFLTAYAGIAVLLAAFVGALDYDPLTAITTSLTALGNVGPGLGEVGPFDNFAHFPATAKVVLAGAMVLGRLEIFTLLVFLSPEFWRR